jgi:hypothetical protein
LAAGNSAGHRSIVCQGVIAALEFLTSEFAAGARNGSLRLDTAVDIDVVREALPRVSRCESQILSRVAVARSRLGNASARTHACAYPYSCTHTHTHRHLTRPCLLVCDSLRNSLTTEYKRTLGRESLRETREDAETWLGMCVACFSRVLFSLSLADR